MKDISRRKFMGRAVAGIGLGVVGTATTACTTQLKPTNRETRRRGVKVATIDLQHLVNQKTIEGRINSMLGRMEKAAAYQPDIICLAETFNRMFVQEESTYKGIAEDELSPGPVTSRMGEFAKKFNCYIVCPIVTKKEGKLYNSSVLLDRQGSVTGIYHKVHPVDTETQNGEGIIPGQIRPPVFETDFGKIGMQICFDVNWFESWNHMKDDGAEIVFFSSAFSGGKMLSFHAWKNNYYIVSSTADDARIIDITGIDIDSSSFQLGYTWASLNLEKEYVPTFPGKYRIPDIQEKYGSRVKIKVLRDIGGGAGAGAGHITIESLDPDLFVKDILKEFEIPVHREELREAEDFQARHRP